MNDLKFAFRQLLKNPGFTAVAVVTLALGIGANTAMFSFVNAILLRPLPYQDPERLVMVFENHPGNGWSKAQVGAPLLGAWRRQSTVFEGLAARGWEDFILTGKERPETLKGSRLSANMFSLLECKPILGRDFLPEEETQGKHLVALLSYELWQRRFGRDSGVIGQSITLNSEVHTIIGVMPPRTFFPERDLQVWAPLSFSANRLSQRHGHRYLVYGKLKPGVTIAQARSEMDVIARRMAEADRESQGWGAEVHPLHEIMVEGFRRTLFVVFGAVAMVLLIGCVNIANLLLTRSAARGREFAIRAALGAERPRIIRQLLTEGVLLATAGSVLGILVAAAGLKFLIQLSPPDLPRVWEGIHLDGLALGFTALISLATGLVFGLVPALQAASPRLAQQLCESGRGNSAGRQRQRVRAALVVSQVALSVMLLIGAGLLIRSFERLVQQSLGFVPENLITVGVTLPDQKYPKESDQTRFLGQLLDRVRSLPGVNSAALVQGVPLSGNNNGIAVWIPDGPPPAPGQSVSSGYAQVSADYFRTMNIPLLQGRDFSEHDRTNTAAVAIVDEMFVKNFKLGTNLIGRRIRLGDRLDSAEIIGVVSDIKRTGLAEAPRGEAYRTYQQICWNGMSLVLRTRRDPADVTRVLRSEVDALDKDQPLENVRTMTQLVSASVAPRRLSVQLLTAFAGVAMLMAAIGLYGVLAHNVTQRRQEIGIRMALGAKRHHVLSLVLGQGMKLAMIGVGIGVLAALTLTRVMQKLLYEIEPTDPLTFTIVSILLLSVALFAGWLPARRAAELDPMEALRYE